MAGTTLCVSCAQLPMKDGSLAVKTSKCPDCQAEVGVTSYGSAFRIQARKRHLLLSPALVTGAIIGAALFTFAAVLIGFGIWSKERIVQQARPADPPIKDGLLRVPEVAVADPINAGIGPHAAKQQIAQLANRIKVTNQKERDAFILANMETRPQLRGLPFIMGDACRMQGQKSQSFQTSVEAVRNGLDAEMHRGSVEAPHADQNPVFWNTYLSGTGNQGVDTDHGIAALTQMLGPERQSLRANLIQKLAGSNRPEATKAIARAAVFDASGDVRQAAIKALKNRNGQEDVSITNDMLMYGLRYPLPVVAKRAATAMIALDRKDVLPQVADFLAETPPGDPIEKQEAEGVCTVREVVRINHHRNCLLCHPPSATGQPNEVPGVIPVPGNPFSSSPKEAYGSAQSMGDPMVRADTTYLRQDFSVMMPVENAAPWPEMQRFDFLVRSREVQGQELAALKNQIQQRPAGFVSDNHQEAVRVLRELTGQENVAPTQAAWRRVLGVD